MRVCVCVCVRVVRGAWCVCWCACVYIYIYIYIYICMCTSYLVRCTLYKVYLYTDIYRYVSECGTRPQKTNRRMPCRIATHTRTHAHTHTHSISLAVNLLVCAETTIRRTRPIAGSGLLSTLFVQGTHAPASKATSCRTAHHP